MNTSRWYVRNYVRIVCKSGDHSNADVTWPHPTNTGPLGLPCPARPRWSLGVCTYVMLCGKPPFWGCMNQQLKMMKKAIQSWDGAANRGTPFFFMRNIRESDGTLRFWRFWSTQSSLPVWDKTRSDILYFLYERKAADDFAMLPGSAWQPPWMPGEIPNGRWSLASDFTRSKGVLISINFN